MTEFRVTTSPAESDIDEIFELLKAYNLSKREKSENIPLAIFLEEGGRKLGYREVFTLREYPYTGSRTYFTKELGKS